VIDSPRIDQLDAIVASLSPTDRALVHRIYQIDVSHGTLQPPAEMQPWLERTFGSVDSAMHQRLVRVMNRWTYDGASFNSLRASRPGSGTTSGSQGAYPRQCRRA